LPAAGLRVIFFDYSGLGLSTGERTYDPAALARDAEDLTEALRFEHVVIGGWSLSGLAAQTFVAAYPNLVSHAVSIGTDHPDRS
jgi:pimeloyl-ACP methyl ester carboxylesterase